MGSPRGSRGCYEGRPQTSQSGVRVKSRIDKVAVPAQLSSRLSSNGPSSLVPYYETKAEKRSRKKKTKTTDYDVGLPTQPPNSAFRRRRGRSRARPPEGFLSGNITHAQRTDGTSARSPPYPLPNGCSSARHTMCRKQPHHLPFSRRPEEECATSRVRKATRTAGARKV